jgi:hypothetical protein
VRFRGILVGFDGGVIQSGFVLITKGLATWIDLKGECSNWIQRSVKLW